MSTFPQIIEEQLAFPSGTATAQLISVLHQIPPPDTSGNARQRRGYRELDTEEAEGYLDPDTPSMPPAEQDVEEPVAAEIPAQESWGALIYSFAASGIMTVSNVTFCCYGKANVLASAGGVFLPCHIRNPAVWKPVGERMVVDIHAKSVIYRARYETL